MDRASTSFRVRSRLRAAPEEECVEITEEYINSANWTELTAVAGSSRGFIRGSFGKPKPQPLVLRNRLKETLAAAGCHGGSSGGRSSGSGEPEDWDALHV